MPGNWEGSTRKARLPSDWVKRRARVKRRAGGRCEWTEQGQRCPEPGTDCDHIVAGDDHALSNLQLLCGAHHKAKSAREGTAGRRRVGWVSERRQAERHPGLAV